MKENISLIKLVTGETLLGICVEINEKGIHMAFPYEVSDDEIEIYLPNTVNRFYPFMMKDIVVFKDVDDETKTKFNELVLAKEPKEYSEFISKFSEIKIPKNCFVIEGNETVH